MKAIEEQLDAHFSTHHGVIGRADVLRLGGSNTLIRSRVRTGAWVGRYMNTYLLVGSPRSPAQELMAALTAVPGAVASHMSAAWVLGLAEDAPLRPHLTVSGQNRPRLDGIVSHRSLAPPPSMRNRGFPCTTATRTLVDLAGVVSPATLTQAVDLALHRRHTAIAHLELALETTERHRRGAGALRQQLAERGMTATPDPSILESRMDRLLHVSGLPPATPQHWAADGRYRLDYAWPEVRLAVEVKGYVWHSSPESLQADAERERELTQLGWTILSFTWTDVTRQANRVIRELAGTYRQLSTQATRPGRSTRAQR